LKNKDASRDYKMRKSKVKAVAVQLELPINLIPELEKFKAPSREESYKYARAVDGILDRDLSIALPKSNDDAMERTRTYISGKKTFQKKFKFEGDYKQNDNGDLIFLINYWAITQPDKPRTFTVPVTDFLKYKSVAIAGPNISKFKSFLERTRVNTIRANCIFDYEKKLFWDFETPFRILDEITWHEIKVKRKNIEKNERSFDKVSFVAITWGNRYYERIRNDVNLGDFNIEAYVSIPEQSQLSKDLFLFINTYNDEFITDEGENYRLRISLDVLCTWQLNMKESPVWRWKQNLKKPIELLKGMGYFKYNNIDECFVKENKTTYLDIKFITERKNKILQKQDSIFIPASILDKGKVELLTIDENDEIKELLKKEGVSGEPLKELSSKGFKVEYVKEKIEYCKSKGYKAGGIVSALREDYKIEAVESTIKKEVGKYSAATKKEWEKRAKEEKDIRERTDEKMNKWLEYTMDERVSARYMQAKQLHGNYPELFNNLSGTQKDYLETLIIEKETANPRPLDATFHNLIEQASRYTTD